MLVLPCLATYLVIALGGHLVYLRRCAEARAMTDRINAGADRLRHDPRWTWKLIDPVDLVKAGVVSQADSDREIIGELHFAQFLAPEGGPFVIWTCDDSAGHHEYPVKTRQGNSDSSILQSDSQ